MLSNCLHDYLEKQIDCHLPYHHFHDKSLGLKNCSTLLEFQTWLQYLMDFQGLTENKLATELGVRSQMPKRYLHSQGDW